MPEARKLAIELSAFDLVSLWAILGISLVALLFAGWLVRSVLSQDEGTPTMIEIARAIQEGAAAYLGRQFRTLRIFVGLLTVCLRCSRRSPSGSRSEPSRSAPISPA